MILPIRSGEHIVHAHGVDLCVETFGERRHPAILLIAGMASSMDWWEVGFCERLAAGPRFVVRYDHRDTGRSTHDPAGAPRYTSRDLAADAAGLLEALDLERAGVVAISMGGAIAQTAALDYPQRVASLTLMSTSALGPNLPGMSEKLRAQFAAMAPPADWSDRAAVIDYVVAGARPLAGSRPFDEGAIREIAGRAFDRTIDVAASLTNHELAPGEDGPWWQRLGEISMPTLVIHGDEDPLFPLEHGQALAKGISGAELLVLEQTGHELPRAAWDIVIPAILRLTEHAISTR